MDPEIWNNLLTELLEGSYLAVAWLLFCSLAIVSAVVGFKRKSKRAKYWALVFLVLAVLMFAIKVFVATYFGATECPI